MSALIRNLSITLLLSLLAACGGDGGDGGGGEPAEPEPPVARASANLTEVNAGEQSVTLDGSDSTSPNGDITGWEWRFLSQPEDSEAELTGADGMQAGFTPDVPGDYTVRLIVTDGEAESADTQESRVTVSAVNPNPLAVVPDEINWIIGTVQLDGSRSQPPDGGESDQLVYHWELTRKPEDSTAQLDSGSLIYPRFTADKVGLYRAELVVTYGNRASEPATVDIHIVEANAEPMAKIADLQDPTMLGDTVTLDGSVSEDADGDPLQYRWRFLARAGGSAAELSSTTTAETSFVADSRAGYTGFRVELCVFDGISRNCTDTIVRPGLPEDAGNTPPVAAIYAPSGTTYEAERGAMMRVASESYDVDGDALTETWSFVSYPDGFDPEEDADLDAGWSAGFTPTVDGEYVVKLEVSDGEASDEATQTYTARIGANREPETQADTVSGNPTTMVGNTVTFDGEGSSDPDDNQLSYQWTLRQRPDGSAAELQDADTAHPTLTPDVAGPYLVSLVVTDEHGWSDRYRPGSVLQNVVVLAKASNHPPVTRIRKTGVNDHQQPRWDAQQPFAIMNNMIGEDRPHRSDFFTLVADSYDPDGDPLSHLWTLTSEAPEGNRMEVNDLGGSGCYGDPPYTGAGEETWEEFRERVEDYTEWPCDILSLSPTEAGLYAFEYQVYDGSEFAGPYTATVHAVQRDNYPSLLLEVPNRQSGVEFFSQAVFPWETEVAINVSQEFSESPLVDVHTFRLTASGGDYTLTDVATPSDDPSYTPRFMDVTNGGEIDDGYTLAQGESVEVVLQVEVPASQIPGNDGNLWDQLAENLNAANISGSFQVEGKDDWTVTLRPEFW